MEATVWRRTWYPSPVLVLEERGGPGGVVYARWWVTRPGGQGRWRRLSTGLRVRPAGAQPVAPERERRVLELGERMHGALRAGRDVTAESCAGRAVRDVLDAYLRTEARGLSQRYRADLERAAEALADLLGLHTPWAALTPASGRSVWVGLAEGSDGAGERWAVRVVELLWRAGAWAALRGLTAGQAALSPPRGWRRALAADWARLARAGGEAPAAARERYTEDEARRLWAALPFADPRLRLAVELGAPALRLGQVVRVRRSDLDLKLGLGVQGMGRVRVRGARGKAGTSVDLDLSARRAVDEALCGLLAERERAYRAGVLQDYALVPGGRLVDGVAPVAAEPLRPLSPSALRVLYGAWERAAGVSHTPSRGWHGLRRLATDLAAADCQDADVLDRVGGWAPGSAARSRVYRDHADRRAHEAAEVLRAQVRARVQSRDRQESPLEPRADPKANTVPWRGAGASGR